LNILQKKSRGCSVAQSPDRTEKFLYHGLSDRIFFPYNNENACMFLLCVHKILSSEFTMKNSIFLSVVFCVLALLTGCSKYCPAYISDSCYLNSGNWQAVASTRAAFFMGPLSNIEGAPLSGITGPHEYRDFWSGNPMSFGSWHVGVCNFTLGDGSVSSVSSTINAALLARLTIVKDGYAVSLP